MASNRSFKYDGLNLQSPDKSEKFVTKSKISNLIKVEEKPIDICLSGSTCTFAIQTDKFVICAYIGDSKVFIGSREKTSKK